MCFYIERRSKQINYQPCLLATTAISSGGDCHQRIRASSHLLHLRCILAGTKLEIEEICLDLLWKVGGGLLEEAVLWWEMVGDRKAMNSVLQLLLV